MKKIILILLLVVAVSCKDKAAPKIYFKQYNETSELEKQKEHENPRMKFKLIQSKSLDMNTVFAPLENELTKFSEKEYQKVKPLILEKDIPSLQKSIFEGKLSYEKLALFYLYRIRKFESDSTLSLNSIITLNPNVLIEAREKDKKRKASFNEYSVYGMPIVLKDNINTKGMPTTAGAMVLANNKNTEDAFIVERLRKKGALILGKVNLSEWAYFFCTGCPLGYSAVGGQTLNPYGRKIFETGGSSAASGVTVAANFAVAAIGTETSGSITSPSSLNSVVGLKPTIGVLSRTGIVPISSTLDTPGPMTKSVIDNAIVLSAMLGYDEDEAIYKKVDANEYENININKESVKGKKLGVLTSLLNDSIYKLTIDKLALEGAEIIELTPPEVDFEGFLTLLSIDMKHDLPKYLKNHSDKTVSVRSVKDIITFNKKDSLVRAPYGQQLFEGILKDTTTLEGLAKIKSKLQFQGEKYLEALKDSKVDVILSINNYHSGIAAVAKYPTLTVPMGYKNSGEPISLTFIGLPMAERKLLTIGYAFEQLTKARKMPENYQ